MAQSSEPTGDRLRTRPHPDPAYLAAARWRLLAGLAIGYLTAATIAVAVLGTRAWGVLFALFVVAITVLHVLEPDQ